MTSTPTLYYDTGQDCTIVLDTNYRDGYGVIIDPINPTLEGVIGPNMVSLEDFPINMERLGDQVGIFFAKFTLPVGVTSVGTYLAIVKWVEPIVLLEHKKAYTIVVGIPFGNASVVGT